MLFGVLVLLGATVYSVSSRRLAAERVVRLTGVALLTLGAAAGAVLWARAHGGVRVDAPVQLWLLLAACLISGGVAVHSSRL
jgi:drug/metabolite transporter (DMT)-like permease